MKKTLLDYRDYKDYLRSILSSKQTPRGLRSKLAQSMGCHLAYISQVVSGVAQLTLEQAAAANIFFGHAEDEAHYFLLLVHHSRAGTPTLRNYYEKQIANVLDRQFQIKEKIKSKSKLSLEDQLFYYNSWLGVAIHVLVSIPKLQTKEELAAYLKLPLDTVSKYLRFMVSCGILEETRGRYTIKMNRLHLPADSFLIEKHHTNWRIKAIDALSIKNNENLHFSTLYSLSRADVQKVKRLLLELVQEVEPIIAASPEEIAYCLSFDFFEV